MQLNNLQKDILIEVANIAFGNASSALSSLINEKIEINVPTLTIETVEEASDTIGSANTQITEVLLKMSGDLSGITLIILKPKEAQSLNHFVNKGNNTSVLPEIGNILVGSALKAISHFLKLKVSHSIPDIATDMSRALLVSSIFLLGEETDTILMLGSTFSIPTLSLTMKVYFLFDKTATHKIIDAI